MPIDRDYYRNRAVQERSIAQRAQRDESRRIHLELAARYTALTLDPADQALVPMPLMD